MARNRRSIAGRPAMITGAASGIGRSLARLLSRTGSPVAIAGRYRCFCASVPNNPSSLATTVCPPIAPASVIQPRASSWVTST